MSLKLFAIVICTFVGLVFVTIAKADTEGQCGGAYTGQDGQSYTCAQNRKPYCLPNGRCQCLERKACPGGKQDEEW
ncbi:MAG: hypothetical protein ACLPSF_04320 [Methylocella sp.]